MLPLLPLTLLRARKELNFRAKVVHDAKRVDRLERRGREGGWVTHRRALGENAGAAF